MLLVYCISLYHSLLNLTVNGQLKYLVCKSPNLSDALRNIIVERHFYRVLQCRRTKDIPVKDSQKYEIKFSNVFHLIQSSFRKTYKHTGRSWLV